MQYKESAEMALSFYDMHKEEIDSLMPNSTVYSVENEKGLLRDFDTRCCTDLICLNRGRIHFVALRMNFCPLHHDFITIRYSRYTGSKTEYQKTIEAIEFNSITANFGIQIDVEKDKIIRGILYDRIDLIKKLSENKGFLDASLREVPEDDRRHSNFMLKIHPMQLDKYEIKHIIKSF
jgi:hypothetical protein